MKVKRANAERLEACLAEASVLVQQTRGQRYSLIGEEQSLVWTAHVWGGGSG